MTERRTPDEPGRFESGPMAGSGPGGPAEEDEVQERLLSRSDDGPAGTMDSSTGDLDEAGA